MKTLIAIPCMDMVHTEFMKSLLGMKPVGECRYALTASSLVYDARNSLVRQAIEENCDRILWLDSDMTFSPNLMIQLAADLDEGREIVSGMYFKRRSPVMPVCYKEIGYFKDESNGRSTPVALSYEDYPQDQIFECKGFGFGACMHTVDIARRVVEEFGLPFSPILGFGEDLSFCMRLTKLGIKIWCDSAIKLGHIGSGAITEAVYLAEKAKPITERAD